LHSSRAGSHIYCTEYGAVFCGSFPAAWAWLIPGRRIGSRHAIRRLQARGHPRLGFGATLKRMEKCTLSVDFAGLFYREVGRVCIRFKAENETLLGCFWAGIFKKAGAWPNLHVALAVTGPLCLAIGRVCGSFA